MLIQEMKGHIALITGATRGIGQAIALALAHSGVRVVGTATTLTGVDKITQNLSSFEGCSAALLDVTDTQAVNTLIDKITADFGALHILVNNAGITKDMLAMRLKDEDWDAVINTNLKSVFTLSKAAIRPMMKQKWGRIINITSVVGASGNPGQANYAASKAGVAGLTRSLAKELGSRNITVNCVAPGFIDTDMTAALSQDQQKALISQIPLNRLGQPSDVANLVQFLASPLASYITGQEIHVNGGMLMI
jgi:3-oxoacyl-[acyl-carrier protein] reductase